MLGWDLLDPANREDGGLEFLLFGNNGFDAEVLHAGFIEDDGVGDPLGIERPFLSHEGDRRQEQDIDSSFHGYWRSGFGDCGFESHAGVMEILEGFDAGRRELDLLLLSAKDGLEVEESVAVGGLRGASLLVSEGQKVI